MNKCLNFKIQNLDSGTSPEWRGTVHPWNLDSGDPKIPGTSPELDEE